MDKIPLWIVVATTALLSLVLYVGYASLDSIMSPIFYAPVLPLLLFVMLKCVDPEGVFGMLGTVVAADGATGAVLHPPEKLGGGEARMRCVMKMAHARKAKRARIPPSMVGMFAFLAGFREVTLIGLESEFVQVQNPAAEPTWFFMRNVDNSTVTEDERLAAGLMRKLRLQEYAIQAIATEAATYKSVHANSMQEHEARFMSNIFETIKPITELSKAASYGRQQPPQPPRQEVQE